MTSEVTIGVINDSGLFGKKMMILWLNYLTRQMTVRFLHDTEEIYFRSLINVLKERTVAWRIYAYFDIIELRKRIAMIELNPDLLLTDNTEGEIERANLKDAKNLIIITKRSLLRPTPLWHLILHIKGKRRFLRKVVKDPTVILIEEDKIITNKMMQFLQKRFKNYKIFKMRDNSVSRIDKINIEDFSQPFIWIFNRTALRLSFLFK
ncbi:MAG: hypothetical protein ACP6IP_01980 [Candidatus Njordarchaeia archaeon]